MSDETIKPIEDLAAQGAEQPQPGAPTAAETAPSGGDGAQGLELPASSEASEPKGEGAQTVDETEAPASSQSEAPVEGESAGEGAASPEPGEALAAPLAEPSAEKLPEEPSAATTTEDAEAGKPAAELLGTEGTEGADAAAAPAVEEAKGDDKSSSEPLDQGAEAAPAAEPAKSEEEPVADEAAKSEEAPAADEPKTVAQVTATGVADVQPIFGGASNPSPAPDLDGQEELPHPALQEHGRGFIPGTTLATQSALPVPGDTGAAIVAAEAIAKAQGVPALPQAETAPVSDEAAGSTSTGDAAAAASEPAAATASDDAPSSDTPAVPTAAHAPEAFGELNSDGSAALDDIDENEAEVLRLELQGLANLALALIKRLDKLGEKKAFSGHLESIQSSAQQVVEQSLNIFEVEAEELSGFDSVSADIILDDLY